MKICVKCRKKQGFYDPKVTNVPPLKIFKNSNKDYCGDCLELRPEEKKES